MRTILARFVDLREGEGPTVLRTFAALFGIIAGHTILETARDALFLRKLPPDRLTLVYAALAALALAITPYNARFAQRFGRKTALLFTLVVSAWGTTVLHFAPQNEAVLYALYVWSGLLGTLLAVQFWMFAGQLFTVAQGRRLFNLIAAAGVLGAVFGATLAVAALEFVSVGSLLLVSAALFVATALHLTRIQPDATRTELTFGAPGRLTAPSAPNPDAAAPPRPVIQAGTVALFREHPYLARIAALVATSTAAVLIADYLFKSVAAARVPPAELGAFFARYYAVLNGISLVVQVALAGRLVRSLGVIPCLVLLPLLLAGGAAGVLVLGGVLIMALVVRGADGALRHSLHRVASELLWVPVPSEVRDRGKSLVDSVFGRLVQAAVAGVLLLLATAGLSSPRLLAAMVLGLAALWILLALGLRRPYLDLFRRALSRGDVSELGEDLDLGSVEAIMEALSSRDAARVIAAMDLLEEKQRSRLIPGLILYHESPLVLVRALGIVARARRDDWVPLAERLLEHQDEAVRAAAVRALGGKGAIAAVERATADPSPAVRAHAAFCLAHCDPERDPRTDPRIAELMSLAGEAGGAARVALLDAIRDHADARWTDVVLAMARSDDALVVEHAALAMQAMQDERFIPILISRLTIRDGRGAVRDALVAHGEPAFDALVETLRDPQVDRRVRVHVPRTISRFGTQRAADVLMQALLAEPSGVIRYKVLRGLGRLVAEYKVKVDRAPIEAQMRKNLLEYLRLLALWVPIERGQRAAGRESAPPAAGAPPRRGAGGLILGLLEDKQKQSLERAFRLLQIAHRNEDIRTVHSALRTGDRHLRAHALEFLDNLTNRADADAQRSRELLRLVADDLPPEERVARAAALLPARPATYQEAVSALLREKDESLAALAAYHALEMGEGGLREKVQEAYRQRPALSLEGTLERFGLEGAAEPPLKEALGVG